MALRHYLWSRTAASNATADPDINFAEGQAPSSVNDSARALMASAAGFRDDISGAIATGGTSTAYTISSYQVFNSLANMNGQMVAFTPHTTNGATVTLNVDGLGAKPLRSAPSAELPAGVLVQGTPYVALYNNSDSAWYLHNFFVTPYTVPVGGVVDYIGPTAPSSSFVFPYGQAISRTVYSTLFSIIGGQYGSGDGSTTFNLPDLRGRVIAGKDDMGGSSANRLTAADDGLNGDNLGATGGGETQTLVTANLPAYTPTGTITSVLNNNNIFGITTPGVTVGVGGTATGGATSALASNQTVSSGFSGNAQGGTSTAFGVVQPTIILNKLLRVI